MLEDTLVCSTQLRYHAKGRVSVGKGCALRPITHGGIDTCYVWGDIQSTRLAVISQPPKHSIQYLPVSKHSRALDDVVHNSKWKNRVLWMSKLSSQVKHVSSSANRVSQHYVYDSNTRHFWTADQKHCLSHNGVQCIHVKHKPNYTVVRMWNMTVV